MFEKNRTNLMNLDLILGMNNTIFSESNMTAKDGRF